MKKFFACLLLVVNWTFCDGQNLTDDYSAFEHLAKDVNSIVDSCLCAFEKNTQSRPTINLWMVVCLDSNGYICMAKVVGKEQPFEDEVIICIERALLSANQQYDIYIEDYQYLKTRYWDLHECAMYSIPYKTGNRKT